MSRRLKLRHRVWQNQAGQTVRQVTDGAFRYWIDADGRARYARDPWHEDCPGFAHGRGPERRTALGRLLAVVRAARSTLALLVVVLAATSCATLRARRACRPKCEHERAVFSTAWDDCMSACELGEGGSRDGD